MSSNDNMHYDDNCFSCFLQGFSLLISDTTNKSSEHYKAASTHSFESWGLSLLTTSSQPLPHYPRHMHFIAILKTSSDTQSLLQ